VRIGYGYDAHRFKAGRPCILCGVQVPSEFGPDGPSDADVAVHALMDALLAPRHWAISENSFRIRMTGGLVRTVWKCSDR
jgi:2-C-methyl-D-erythritol 2,4-cyclodiphosphate synthase